MGRKTVISTTYAETIRYASFPAEKDQGEPDSGEGLRKGLTANGKKSTFL